MFPNVGDLKLLRIMTIMNDSGERLLEIQTGNNTQFSTVMFNYGTIKKNGKRSHCRLSFVNSILVLVIELLSLSCWL